MAVEEGANIWCYLEKKNRHSLNSHSILTLQCFPPFLHSGNINFVTPQPTYSKCLTHSFKSLSNPPFLITPPAPILPLKQPGTHLNDCNGFLTGLPAFILALPSQLFLHTAIEVIFLKLEQNISFTYLKLPSVFSHTQSKIQSPSQSGQACTCGPWLSPTVHSLVFL